MADENTNTSYEMLWDCPVCGTRGLLGISHRHCPGCGTAQDPARRYFPQPGEEVEAKSHVYSGIDWRCAYCETPNAAAAKFCVNCSAGQDGSKPVALKTDVAEPPQEDSGAALPAAPPAAPPARAGMAKRFGIIGVIVAGLAAAISMFVSTKDTSATVVDRTWERRIAIERFSPAKEDAWCDSLPAGAYNIARSREVRSQRQVADGETCTEKRVDKGDGSFAKQKECTPRYRDEPVHDDRCRFTINRWQVDRQATATQLDGAMPGCRRFQCPRCGARRRTQRTLPHRARRR
jgi:hypothetical protein